jgi:uncharacterized protein YbjT (DUF2867 family)
VKVVLFGATGMVGQAVLRECLLESGFSRVFLRKQLGQARALNGRHDHMRG